MRMKIGKAKNVAHRVRELQTGNPEKMELLAMMPCLSEANARYMEKQAHKYFAFAHSRGEWFRYGKDIGRRVRRWIENNKRSC